MKRSTILLVALPALLLAVPLEPAEAQTEPVTSAAPNEALARMIASFPAENDTDGWVRWWFFMHGADEATREKAVRIRRCESGHGSGLGVVSRTRDHGPMQLNWRYQRSRWLRLGYTDRQVLWSASANAHVAADLWREQGFRPWVCARKLGIR